MEVASEFPDHIIEMPPAEDNLLVEIFPLRPMGPSQEVRGDAALGKPTAERGRLLLRRSAADHMAGAWTDLGLVYTGWLASRVKIRQPKSNVRGGPLRLVTFCEEHPPLSADGAGEVSDDST